MPNEAFQIQFDPNTRSQLSDLESRYKSTQEKVELILEQIQQDPFNLPWKHKRLKGEGVRGIFISIKLNDKDRICYRVDPKLVIITVLSILGHYGDH